MEQYDTSLDPRMMDTLRLAAVIAKSKLDTLTDEETRTLQIWLESRSDNRSWYAGFVEEEADQSVRRLEALHKESKTEFARVMRKTGLTARWRRYVLGHTIALSAGCLLLLSYCFPLGDIYRVLSIPITLFICNHTPFFYAYIAPVLGVVCLFRALKPYIKL